MPDQRSVDRADRRPGRWGRRVASILVWIAMIYAGVAAFVSVVPQVFWPQAPAWAVKSAPQSCAVGLEELESELTSRAAEVVGAGGARGPASLRRWLSHWDARFLALDGRCSTPEEAKAYGSLNRLRHMMETTLMRFDREEGKIHRELAGELHDL